MPSKVTVTGVEAMRAKLQQLTSRLPDEVGRALYLETEIEATECKRRTPVDTGALQSSIHVEGPKRAFNGGIYTEIVAGGPAAPYALAVHENLDAFHNPGQAKFIESTINESAPHMAARVARRIDLNRLI